jgi:hypothetical protein
MNVLFFQRAVPEIILNNRKAYMSSTAIRQDDFDAILVSELEIVRDRERRLKRLYSRLRKKPELREVFVCELAKVQRRAERLHAVLNPCGAFESAATTFCSPTIGPAA